MKESKKYPFACGDCDPCIGGRPDQCAVSYAPHAPTPAALVVGILKAGLCLEGTDPEEAKQLENIAASIIDALSVNSRRSELTAAHATIAELRGVLAEAHKTITRAELDLLNEHYSRDNEAP